MAMPSSGCVALRTCISGIACSSISCAVAGVACSPTGLSSISVQAGKSAPHSMSEFYGYSSGLNVSTYLIWKGGQNTFDGLGGSVSLKCSNGNNVCTSSISNYSKQHTALWNDVPSATYYVDFGSVLIYSYTEAGVVGKNYNDNVDGLLDFVESTNQYVNDGLREMGYDVYGNNWGFFINEMKNVLVWGIYNSIH